MKARLIAPALITAAAIAAFAVPATARADAVTTWNTYASNVLTGPATSQAPNVAALHLAMVHGAIYDAVNAIDGGHEGYLLSSRVGSPFDSQDAATATAAYRVLTNIVPLLNLVPSPQSTLDAQYAAYLAGIPDGMQKTRGVAVGEAAAAAMIAARTGDGRFGPFRNSPGTLPGEWRPALPAFVNDPNAWLAKVKPFLIDDPAEFRSAGPLDLQSPRYAREFNEVKAIGAANSTVRTADQTHAARYWAENPPATWSRVFRTLSAQQGVSLVDDARLYAMLYLTAADALIAVWDDKAERLFWRPITAIREADTDGNPRTEPQADWTPLIPTPPYPEHPSGHTGLSGSIVKTLQQFFGTDDIGWTDTNGGGLTRSFSSFSQAIHEIEGARVWSGIHFPISDKQGEQIGRKVATYRQGRYFRPGRCRR
jgi:hypothetical protein